MTPCEALAELAGNCAPASHTEAIEVLREALADLETYVRLDAAGQVIHVDVPWLRGDDHHHEERKGKR
jgi:hypothetical protein